MKRWLLLASILVVGAAAAILLRNRASASTPKREPAKKHATPNDEPASVGVDQLMRKVDRYRSRSIRVEGVVSAASPKEQILSLIDCQEFKECGQLGCAKLTLPVRWAGAMPALKDTVRVKGEIQKNGGKLIFVASAVEEVPR